jgi:cystathionine beta-lyase/cystathionine gamma-synthase
LQSATKYIGGHSDVIAGVLSGSREMIERIFNSEYMNIGSGIQPFNAWLLIRGLRTLPMRLERITKTTAAIVEYLKQNEKVEKVFFPFDPGFPQYTLAKKQMKNACGLLSFVLKAGTVQEIETFCESLRHFFMAVSWGGHESLIIPRCAGIKREAFDANNPEHRMIRMYVGLEDAGYLVKDLTQAFAGLK